MVKRSVGPRSKTRHKLSKKPRFRGMPPPSHALREFAPGSKVDVVINPTIHGGMPHSRFHGLVGTIIEKRGQAYVIDLPVGNKHKTLVARPEHLQVNGARRGRPPRTQVVPPVAPAARPARPAPKTGSKVAHKPKGG